MEASRGIRYFHGVFHSNQFHRSKRNAREGAPGATAKPPGRRPQAAKPQFPPTKGAQHAMRIGFLTNALVEQSRRCGDARFTTLPGVADWAAAHGFQDLECGPMLPLDRAAFEQVLGERKISITALIYCRNYLSTDEEEAASHLAELKKRIVFAGELGIEKVVTSTGIDKRIEEGIYDRDPAVKDRANLIRRIPVRSLDRVVDLFGPLTDLAEKHGVKLCFENCPLMGNIAISPAMWERIFHVHAKDTRIDRERLARTGILTDFSWWAYAIPGRGELDWAKLLAALKQIGYTGTVSLEHEDALYEGSVEKVQEGLLEGKRYLENLLH